MRFFLCALCLLGCATPSDIDADYKEGADGTSDGAADDLPNAQGSGGDADGGDADGGTSGSGSDDGSAGGNDGTDGGSASGGSTDGGSTDGGSTSGGSTSGGSTSGGSTSGGSTDGGSTGSGSSGGSTPSLPCPDGVVCFHDFPASHSGDTSTSGIDVFDAYSCAPSTSEVGPEVVYRLTVSESGLLALELTDMESGADVDVHLLASESASDCISRGHWVAGGFVEAGDYWVVADSWTNASGVELSGAYTLNMGFTSVSDLTSMGMDIAVAEDALYAMGVAFENEDPDHLFFSVTDFSLHSSERRMWVLDLFDGSLLWNLHVTHGEHSSSGDSGYSDVFSNINDSHQSSLGMMKGAELYSGSFGGSMRIDGLEDGYNDLVRPRAIVMHGAEYAREEFVADYGRAGESWGCPALDDRLVGDVIDVLSDGGMMFFWYPDGDWSVYSDYLR